jgi:predicted Zn-dependent peptidase
MHFRACRSKASARFFIIFLLLILLPPVFPLFAQSLGDRVVERTLSNGLRVLMVERHEVPIVALNITYGVGSVNEHTGISGVAHLYEHMAFKGTETLGTRDYAKERPLLAEMDRLYRRVLEERAKGARSDPEKLAEWQRRFDALQKKADTFVVTNEIGEVYDRNGAVGFNASTGRDVTSYVISLPSNRLPLWIAIESDRMRHPVLREFYKEKEVVLEERRRSVETSPGGKLREAFLSAAFVAHPYGIPTLGWPSDVRALTSSETEAFFKSHYAPNNTVIAMVGDIDPEKTVPMLERSFGKIPRQPIPSPVVTEEPPQGGERRVEVEYDAQPELIIGYHKPGIDDPDDTTFDVIDALLSEGRSSRLYKSLVEEKKIALSVSTSNGSPGGRYPNLFTISATPRAPHTAREVEEAIYAELERLKKTPPESRELEKVLTNLDASLIRSLRSNGGLAAQLAYFESVAGSWRYLLENRDRIAKTTGEDVMRAAEKYLVKRNRTVAVLVPEERTVTASAGGEISPAPLGKEAR